MRKRISRRRVLRGLFSAFVVHTACRGSGPGPSSPSPIIDPLLTGAQDIVVRTLRGDGAMEPVAGATVASGAVRTVTDESGIAWNVAIQDSSPVVASANGCLSYASPLRADSILIRDLSAGGSLRFLSTLHSSSIISLSPRTVYVSYPPEIWADEESLAVARRLIGEFEELSRYAIHRSELVIGPGPGAGDLVIPVTVNPALPDDIGGRGHADSLNGIVVNSEVQIREAWFAHDFRFMFHEVIGHAMLALVHPEGPGIMDPATMYHYDGIDPMTRMALMVSLARSPRTEFDVDSTEVDPQAKGVSMLNASRVVTQHAFQNVCQAPPRVE